MSPIIQNYLIREVKEELTQLLKSEYDNSNLLIRAFLCWANIELYNQLIIQTLMEEALLASKNSLIQFNDIASIGFILNFSKKLNEKELNYQTLKSLFLNELSKLINRPVEGNPQVESWRIDVISLLGLCLGLSATSVDSGDNSANKWLENIIYKCFSYQIEPIVLTLLLGALNTLNISSIDSCTPHPCTSAFLKSKSLTETTENQEIEAFEIIILKTNKTLSVDAAAIYYGALSWLLRKSANLQTAKTSINDVIYILKGIGTRTFKRWCWEDKARSKKREATPVKWQIQNEYHVQDLLWSVLSPIFPDLEDEENLPSFGQKHPRYDLGIPSLKLIIEVKFIYNGQPSEFANIIEGIAADTSLYLSEPEKYSCIIPFIWDDSRKTEQYTELISGLTKVNGILDIIIIPKPGKMG